MATRKTKKKETAKRTTNGRGKAMKEALTVASKVKEAIRVSGCNTSGDAIEGLNQIVYWHIEQAATRAKANGRKTVRSHDFIAV